MEVKQTKKVTMEKEWGIWDSLTLELDSDGKVSYHGYHSKSSKTTQLEFLHKSYQMLGIFIERIEKKNLEFKKEKKWWQFWR